MFDCRAFFRDRYAGSFTVPGGFLVTVQIFVLTLLFSLPQVIKRVLPSITNETITLVKDTSLAFTISIAEMFTVAKQLFSSENARVREFIGKVSA